MASQVNTQLLIISDTHGDELDLDALSAVDVAIHCGDLTEKSKMDEYRASLQLLKRIRAPLKLVIAGNHDFTLDTPMFEKKLADIEPPLDHQLVKKEYGDFGEARTLFKTDKARASGIVFLDEGTHHFTLANGALLTVYASPYTPSLSDWGFQYNPQIGHDWCIGRGVDVVITHGPPHGVLDYTDSKQRAGSPCLFAAVARARPRMHCFGHIHEAWGAKRVGWRAAISDTPSHFTDIDNDRSVVVESLAGIRTRSSDTPGVTDEKAVKLKMYKQQGCCTAKAPVQGGDQTLFINAAIEGPDEQSQQLPWVVDIDLPIAVKAPHK
ncbi:hypothetical protein LTR85_009199 [Meristemomyces frigidus]|nr:hypothetical protein LTR85_009199 [Meristemomyces frigidus]